MPRVGPPQINRDPFHIRQQRMISITDVRDQALTARPVGRGVHDTAIAGRDHPRAALAATSRSSGGLLFVCIVKVLKIGQASVYRLLGG
jgi:hypothetical protein